MRKNWINYVFAFMLGVVAVFGYFFLPCDALDVVASNGGANVEVSENGFVVDGYSFNEWQTANTGEVSPDGATYTTTIEYQANGGVFWDSTTVQSEEVSQDSECGATGFGTSLITAPENNGYTFVGWAAEDGTIYQPGDTIEFTWAEYDGMTVIFTAQWVVNAGSNITEAGTYHLTADQEYVLGDGVWTVNSDTSQYVGQNRFYVVESGTYTFTK